ncbi:MAG: histidine--tRNA ligase [Candidatus Thermoplasmatota archaeon]|nr:histidine--tRNA ligase [Candidatus Thermoplasmatota archaeon]
MIERPRGTRDFEPDEMESRKWLEDRLRKKAENFGYREVLTPTFEHIELFLERSGPSIVEEIYSFEDKGGRELALRPEFTASVMRMYSESLRGEPKPLKLFYFGPAFRYERPQSGRYREFWHFGTELIGADTPRADAENIALAYQCMKDLGLDDINLRISNLQILEDYLKKYDLSRDEREELYHMIDKEETDKIEEKFDLDEEFFDLLDLPFEEVSSFVGESSSYEHLKEVMKHLSYYDIERSDYMIDLSTVRGLDYYSGVVFEIDAERLGAQKQICGGGDYNLGDIFDIDISSKGFAIGFDRLHLALEREDKLFDKEREGCYIIPIGEKNISYSYEVLSKLRENNLKADIDLKDRSIGKAIGFADKAGFKYSIIIGEEEVKNEEIALKDMESGEQESIKKEEIIGAI